MSPRVLHTKFCRCVALAVRLYHKRLCNVTKKLGFFKLFRNLHTARSACAPITYILLFHMPAYSSIHLFNIRLIYALVLLCAYSAHTHILLFAYSARAHILLCAYSAHVHILQFSYSAHTHILLFAYSARAHKKASHKHTGTVRTLRVQFTRKTDRTLILPCAYSAHAHKKASHKKTCAMRILIVQFARETDLTLSTTASIRSSHRSVSRRSRPSHC